MKDIEREASAKILVVDDEPINRRLLKNLLQPKGYEVFEAEDGLACLEFLAEDSCDLVLLDCMMPRLNGIETCKRIRAQERLLSLSIVMVTGLAERTIRIQAKEAGADDFLTKPFDQTELMVRVKNLLQVKAYHDLRERQREELEQELELRTSQLIRSERLATLGTLAGGVGHELNNITTLHFLALASIRDRVRAGEPPQEKDLAALDRVGEHLKLHGTHLLELGRPGSDAVEVLDLRDLISATLDLLSRMGRTRRVSVETSFPEHEQLVSVSQARVEQVLVNLIGNAADALGESDVWPKTIRVEVELDDDRGRVLCHVRDNGCGIPADKLEAIFEPYYTTKPPDKGTGLGLPVVKKIIEDLGGELRVESQRGAGSVFTFSLPSASSKRGV